MHSTIRTLLTFCACGTILILSNTAFARQPQLLISCQSTNLVLFEPLIVRVEVLNTTSSQGILIPGRWEELIQIDIRSFKDVQYIPMRRWWRPQVVQPPLPDFVLKPGSSVTVDIAFYPFDRECKLLLEQGQSYEVRASLNVPHLALNIMSNLQTVRIVTPSQEDADAIAELSAHKQLRFWMLPEQIAYDTAIEERASAFSLKHGKTTLGKYINETIRLMDRRLVR